MYKVFLSIAFRGIFRNWRQSFTALTSIAATFVALTLFQGYMDNVEKMYEDTNIEREMMGHLIIENKDSTVKITKAQQEEVLSLLNTDPRVDSKVRFLPISGTITNGSSSMVFVGTALDVKEALKMRGESWSWNALAGRPLTDETDGPLLGQRLSKILSCNPDPVVDFKQGLGGFTDVVRPMNCRRNNFQLNVVTVHGQMNSLTLPATGITDAIYKELDERFLALPLEVAKVLFDSNEISYFSVKLKDVSELNAFLQDLNEKLQDKDLHAIDWKNHRLGKLFIRTMDLLSLFRNLMITVILLISSLSVLNTFIRNISERQREIGTLRSIGFNSFSVRVLFILEAAILAISGCILGQILSFGMEFMINALDITYKPGIFSSPVPFTINVSPFLYGQVSLFLISLVIITAVISLRRPMNKPISECLIHV